MVMGDGEGIKRIHQINTKVNTLMTKSMDLVHLLGLLEIFIEDTIDSMKEKEMEKWCGQMVQSTKVIGSKEFSMAEEK